MHPDKTRILYCQDVNRRKTHNRDRLFFLDPNMPLEKPALSPELCFLRFLPAVGKQSLKKIKHHNKHELALWSRVDLSLAQIAEVDQSNGQGMAWLLWNFVCFSSAPSLPLFQRHVDEMGPKKIQKTQSWKNQCVWLALESSCSKFATVCPLELCKAREGGRMSREAHVRF